MNDDNIVFAPLYVDGIVYETQPYLRPGYTCPVCGKKGDGRYLHIVGGVDCVADKGEKNDRQTKNASIAGAPNC